MTNATPLLQADHLTIGYRNVAVFKGLNLCVYPGEVICLLGANGIGKSTLIKTILGVIPPIDGDITLAGRSIREISSVALAREISVVLTDRISKSQLSVRELVALGRIPHTNLLGTLHHADLEAISQAIKDVGLEKLATTPVGELSDGQLQKAMLARALAQDGKLLVLDEPTAHLDLINRYEIMHLLRSLAKKKQKAILIVTHDLTIALDTADRLGLMNHQGLIMGLTEDLVINGSINLLFPNENLYFDCTSRRVIVNDQSTPKGRLGQDSLSIWVEQALMKQEIGTEELKIEIDELPFNIKLIKPYTEKRFSRIFDLIEFLKLNQ